MRAVLVALVAVTIAAGAAFGRPVTEEEKTKLASAVTAAGCTGGTMEFDDGKFEVDDAICADGKKYDLDFDRSFRLINKAAGAAAAPSRPVTQAEKTKLAAAVTAAGCSGGTMEFNDGVFEVDDAVCADGKKYDLDFDRSFRLVKKELGD